MLRGLQASWRSCSIEKKVFAELCSTTGILVAELFCFLGILQKINVGHTLGNKRGEQFGQQRNPAATTTRQQICRWWLMDPEVSWRRGWRFGSAGQIVVAGVARRLRRDWIRRRSFEQRCLYRPHGPHGQRDSALWKLSHRQGDHKVVVPRPIFVYLFFGACSHNSRPAGPQILVICCIKPWIFRPLSGDGSLPPQPGSFKGALWFGALVPASSGYWICPCWQRDCLISPISIEKYRLIINDKYW